MSFTTSTDVLTGFEGDYLVLDSVTHSAKLYLVITDKQANLHVFQNDGQGNFIDIYQHADMYINDVQDINLDGIGDLIVKYDGSIKVFDGVCE